MNDEMQDDAHMHRLYDRSDGEKEESLVFNKSTSLLSLMDIARLEFPGTKFDLLVVGSSKEGQVSMVRKHEKVKMP
ncbi:MAG: hypothetical protein US74_C0052G0007 [Parcubacteria group bacterium GW2011_GWA2_38_13]|nr:MAG: hypothetical protein US74_C0052G0007 [Parcubacteria group bacterium GW2011_GWA2_38_13]